MKKSILFLVVICAVSLLFATKIQFSSQYVFYRIGNGTETVLMEISEYQNTLSGRDLGDYNPQTEFKIIHHQFSIYIDEGDSVNSYSYRYRFYPVNGDTADWQTCNPHYFGQYINTSGNWYGLWSLDKAFLFELPSDTGDYCLEFAFSASVRGPDGDTLTADYVSADSLPMICYIGVLPPAGTGTEDAQSIELGRFHAEVGKGQVNLNWTTESETENSHFLIYRDGEVIAQVEGAGTSSETHNYRYLDTRVQAGVYSYAIADVSYGGVVEMHESIEVEVKAEDQAMSFQLNKVYPNPFNPGVTINYQLSTINRVKASIYRVNGELVADIINEDMPAGTHEVTWDASNMSSGVYIVRMTAGDMVQSQKIVLMK